MRGKHTCKTVHVATLLSAPAGGALVLPSDDGAGSDERQDVAWHMSPKQDQTPAAQQEQTSPPVPTSQVPSLSPLPHPLLPTLGAAASLLELGVD